MLPRAGSVSGSASGTLPQRSRSIGVRDGTVQNLVIDVPADGDGGELGLNGGRELGVQKGQKASKVPREMTAMLEGIHQTLVGLDYIFIKATPKEDEAATMITKTAKGYLRRKRHQAGMRALEAFTERQVCNVCARTHTHTRTLECVWLYTRDLLFAIPSLSLVPHFLRMNKTKTTHPHLGSPLRVRAWFTSSITISKSGGKSTLRFGPLSTGRAKTPAHFIHDNAISLPRTTTCELARYRGNAYADLGLADFDWCPSCRRAMSI
jgi:hypothetical protein